MKEQSLLIKTPRLALRPFSLSDAEDMYALNADPEVVKYTGDDPFESIEAARKFINAYDAYKKYGYGRWTLLFEGKYAGWCGLNFNPENKETDLGFRLLKKYWNLGIGTEAATACVDYGFKDLGVTKIIGRAMEENTGSIRILQKIGMSFEKEFEAHGGRCVQYAIWKYRTES